MVAIFGCCLTVALHRPIHHRAAISAITLLVIVVLLIFPIGGLFGFHIVLISNGRTTNEHVTGKYRGNNFFSRGFCQNFLHLFCGSLAPQHKPVKIKKKKAKDPSEQNSNNDDNNNVILDSNQISPSNSNKINRVSISDNESDNSIDDDDDDDDELRVNNSRDRKDPELLDIMLKTKKNYKFNRKSSISSTDSITSASMLNQNSKKHNNNNVILMEPTVKS